MQLQFFANQTGEGTSVSWHPFFSTRRRKCPPPAQETEPHAPANQATRISEKTFDQSSKPSRCIPIPDQRYKCSCGSQMSGRVTAYCPTTRGAHLPKP